MSDDELRAEIVRVCGTLPGYALVVILETARYYVREVATEKTREKPEPLPAPRIPYDPHDVL